MTSPSDPRRPARTDLDSILREGPWIRRLARGLLGDGAAADDLSQEVLATAIDQRPALEARPLRAWLRTVARRLASRQHERDRNRARVEERVARPEAVEHDARRHLRLHRELSVAIDGLDPIYRTVLVLRYLEGLPPREIAERLDISATAARKRVSRGLALLRERLDAEHGRENWSVAVASLLLPTGSAAPPVGAETTPTAAAPTTSLTGSALTLLATMTPKTLLVVLSVAVAAGLLLLADPFGSSSLEGAGETTEGASAVLADHSPTEGGAVATEPATVDGEDERRPAGVAEPVVVDPRVRVMLTGGGLADGASVAWVDAGGHVHPIELDQDGSAVRPARSGGARFFACAPDCSAAFVRAGDAGEDVDVLLEPARVLRGRIVEDGGPPVRSLHIWALESNRDRGLATEEWRLRQPLEDAGAMRAAPECWTRPDGSFVLEGLRVAGTGILFLPTTHRPIVDGVPLTDARARYDAADQDVVIETVLLPTVFGRLAWEDDGSPVVGTLSIVFEERETGSSFLTHERADPSGNFAVGLPVSDRAMLGQPGERPAALLHRAVVIGIDDVNGVSTPFERRVELADEHFPIDLGTVRVPRATVLAVRVTGADGEPVEGAVVVSSVDDATSGPDGGAELSLAQGDELQVLAPGHAYATFPSTGPGTADPPLELRLVPGSTLSVVQRSADGGVPDSKLPIQLAWDVSPFEGAHVSGEPPFAPMPQRVHRVFHRDATFNGTWSFAKEGAPGRTNLTPGADGRALVPGLRAGSVFTISVVDGLMQELVEIPVEMPASPGIHEVDLTGELENPSRLRVRMVDEDGEPVANGSVFVRRGDGRRGRSFGFEGGLLSVGPLAARSYSLKTQVSGFMPQEIASHELTPETPVLELALERARGLAVTIEDEAGEPISPESVRLEAPDGWSARDDDASIGRASFRTVPRRPLEVVVTIGTRVYREPVDADEEVATVTVPRHGRLAIRFSEPPELQTEDGDIRARIHEVDGDGEVEIELWYTEKASEELALETELLPGQYRLELDLVEWLPGSLDTDDPLVRELDRREITIEAGEVTHVEPE